MSFQAPFLLFADETGNILEFSDLEMVGASAGRYVRLQQGDWIPLPPGSELFQLPGRLPVGYDSSTASFRVLERNPYTGSPHIQAVAAFIAPANTQLYSAAYKSSAEAAVLPLFAYTAVGWHNDGFVVSGLRIDEDPRQDSDRFDPAEIRMNARRMMKEHKNNRLVQHLGHCALGYGCPAAKNYFLQRWEAPLPTSPACNARCLGCISLQEGSEICATQERIRFVPTPQEIAQVATAHLQNAPRAVASFGQGCEGEPLTEHALIAESVREIRKRTGRGTINLNTNGSMPDRVREIAACGLDSIRISMNSARSDLYRAYYRPRGYDFEDVVESLCEAGKMGLYTMINLLVFPGVSDREKELRALKDLIRRTGVRFLHLKNLCIDPRLYLERMPEDDSPAVGMRRMARLLTEAFPQVSLGYFNQPVRD